MTLLFSIQGGQLKEKIFDKVGLVDILPLAAFLVGLSSAATVGIYARTNDWFGVNPISFKKKWETKDKDPSGLINLALDKLNNQESTSTNKGVLFSDAENCRELLKISESDILISELQVLGLEWQVFADSVQNNVPKKEQIFILKQKILQNCND